MKQQVSGHPELNDHAEAVLDFEYDMFCPASNRLYGPVLYSGYESRWCNVAEHVGSVDDRVTELPAVDSGS